MRVPDVLFQNVTRSWKQAIFRGLRKKCPCCGQTPMMSGYLTVTAICSNCNTNLSHHQADDAPPYFTITATAHIIIPLLLVVEKNWQPPLMVHAVIWLPTTLALAFWLMPRIKGAIVGLQWALRMHGFAEEQREP